MRDGLDYDAADLLMEARDRYRDAINADRINREAAQDDLRFLAGEQWDPRIEMERIRDGRPVLTVNRLPQFINQVTNDIRLNKPAITVRPVDNGADEKIAETYTGLIRHIEAVSDADAAYIGAAEHAIACGMGHFRIMTRYVADDAWDQEITIKKVRNPFGVVWDPTAQEITREDARFCFVLERVERKTFRKMFPNAALSSMENSVPTDWEDWATRDDVLIAEYWLKKPITRTLVRAPDGQVLDMTGADPAEVDEIVSAGGEARQVEGHKVCSYLISAGEVLAGPFDWPGRFIPVVPVVGSEIVIGDRVVRHGMVRFAKDPQRSFNYHRSAEVETVALQPKAPFLATPEQIKGYEEDWARANQDAFSVLLYNPDSQAGGPPQRIAPPPMPGGFTLLAQEAAEDMKAVTGIYDAALGARSNETSGRAILARQREGDVGSFHYVDNLSKAIAYAGRILVDLIPRIFDNERVVRIIGEDGMAETVPVNVETPDGRKLHDLALGRYDVVVRSGPSFSTRREESAQAMMEFMRVYPPAAAAIGDLVADAMDWPGSKEIAERLRAVMPPGLADAAKAKARGEEPPPMPEAPPGPEQIEAMAKARKAEADAMKAEAEAKKAMAEVEGLEVASIMGAMPEAPMPEMGPPAPAMPAAPSAPSSPVSIVLGEEMQREVGSATAQGAAAMQEAAASLGGAIQTMAQVAEMMAQTSAQVAQMAQAVTQAAAVMAAPKRVVRDDKGRAVGVEAAL